MPCMNDVTLPSLRFAAIPAPRGMRGLMTGLGGRRFISGFFGKKLLLFPAAFGTSEAR
jgi:hypothetical protein